MKQIFCTFNTFSILKSYNYFSDLPSIQFGLNTQCWNNSQSV